MECIVVREITEAMIGLVMITGFFYRKFPAVYNVPFSPVAGGLFVVTSITEIFFDLHGEFLEFFAALILLFMVEKFVTINTGKPPKWHYFGIILAFTLAVVLIKKDIEYFHAGVLVTFGVISLRTGQNIEVFHWHYKEVFYLSAAFGFLAVLVYLMSLHMLSDFLYFGGVMLFLSVIPELAS